MIAQNTSLINNRQLAYGIIPLIPTLEPVLQMQIREAFLQSFKQVWIAFTVCAAVGLLTCAVTREYSLKKSVDDDWGIDHSRDHPPPSSKSEKDAEKAGH